MTTAVHKSLDELYEECLGDMRKVIWDHMRAFNVHPSQFEEMLSRAHIHFMDAYNKYDWDRDTQVKFSTWVHKILYNGLKNDRRYEERHRRNGERPPRPCPCNMSSKALVELLDSLSEDGKRLVLIFRQNQDDLEKILRPNRAFTTGLLIRRFLKNHGWSSMEIRNAIRNFTHVYGT